jgi:hypothetical protein
MHSQPVSAIDKGVASHQLWHEGFVEVWLITEVQLGNTPLGHNATIVCLPPASVQCSEARGRVGRLRPHIHDIVVSLFLMGPLVAFGLHGALFRLHVGSYGFTRAGFTKASMKVVWFFGKARRSGAG